MIDTELFHLPDNDPVADWRSRRCRSRRWSSPVLDLDRAGRLRDLRPRLVPRRLRGQVPRRRSLPRRHHRLRPHQKPNPPTPTELASTGAAEQSTPVRRRFDQGDVSHRGGSLPAMATMAIAGWRHSRVNITRVLWPTQCDGLVTIAITPGVGSRAQIRHRVSDDVAPRPRRRVPYARRARSWTGELRAACWAAVTAARSCRIGPPRRSTSARAAVPTSIEIDVPALGASTIDPGSSSTRAAGSPRRDITEVDGIPIVTTRARSFSQLAWWNRRRTTSRPSSTLRAGSGSSPTSRRTTTFHRHARRGLTGVAATPDRARAVEPGERADRERDGDAAAPDVPRARPARAGPAVRGTRSATACSSPAPTPALPQWKIAIEYQSSRSTRTSSRSQPTIAAATRSWQPATAPLVARIGDLRVGGHELVDEILAVRRLTASSPNRRRVRYRRLRTLVRRQFGRWV